MSIIQFFAGNKRFLMFGMAVAAFASLGQTYFIGIFRPDIMAQYQLSDSSFGAWYLIITLGSAVGLNHFGPLLDKVPLHRWIIVISFLLALAVLCVAMGVNFAMVVIGLLFTRMVGQGLMIHTVMTSMSRYYGPNRGRAISIASLGMPIGQAIYPVLAVYILTFVDWQTTWAYFGLAHLLIALPIMLWLLKGHKERHNIWQAEMDSDTQRDTGVADINLRRKDMLRDYQFYLLMPAVMALPFWVTAVFFYAETIATAKGWTLGQYTGLYWMNAVGAMLVPLFSGSLVDKFGGKRLQWLPHPILATGMFIGIYSDSLLGVSAFLLLLGVSMGFAIPINNAVWAELYGTRYLGEIKSMVTSVLVFSTALAPYLLGLAMDAGYQIETLMWGGVLHGVISIFLVLPIVKSGSSAKK